MAARLLGAKAAIPVHYDGFRIAGVHGTRPAELSRFLDAASAETCEVLTPEQGEDLTLCPGGGPPARRATPADRRSR
ncbi:hypothetical protein ABZV75_34265 [Streptomyces flaveolus]|uniref:hypothetical protein n=1 Tax=Streptomyces flaveolus TaxID=67297 RepID=UPI0033BD73AC